MKLTSKPIILAAAAMVIASSAVLLTVSGAIAAPVIGLTGNATRRDGGGRGIAAVWGDQGPYKVNFSCGVPGCSNYVTSSTTSTSLTRFVEYDVCNSAYTGTHTIHVWMNAGSGTELSATSHTYWTSSPAC
jgi:hypothetical protein